jgi:hypothetical protein
VIPGPWSECKRFYYDTLAAQCFSASQEEYLIEQEVRDNIKDVQRGDNKEIVSFIRQ